MTWLLSTFSTSVWTVFYLIGTLDFFCSRNTRLSLDSEPLHLLFPLLEISSWVASFSSSSPSLHGICSEKHSLAFYLKWSHTCYFLLFPSYRLWQSVIVLFVVWISPVGINYIGSETLLILFPIHPCHLPWLREGTYIADEWKNEWILPTTLQNNYSSTPQFTDEVTEAERN